MRETRPRSYSLAASRRCFRMPMCRPCAQWVGAIPRACRCSAQLGGMSIRRETPRPRGRVPSTAAWTMSGVRKARESPMRADRSLTPSRAAIASMPSTLPEIISSSHRRPLAMADRSFLLASARIGLPPLADSLGGWITSRLRRKACGDQGITINLVGRSESFAEPDFDRPRTKGDFVDGGRKSLGVVGSVGVAARTQQLGRWRAG